MWYLNSPPFGRNAFGSMPFGSAIRCPSLPPCSPKYLAELRGLKAYGKSEHLGLAALKMFAYCSGCWGELVELPPLLVYPSQYEGASGRVPHICTCAGAPANWGHSHGHMCGTLIRKHLHDTPWRKTTRKLGLLPSVIASLHQQYFFYLPLQWSRFHKVHGLSEQCTFNHQIHRGTLQKWL